MKHQIRLRARKTSISQLNELSDLDFNTWQGASDASNALFDLMRGIEPANLALVSNFDSYYLSTPYRLSGDNYDYNMVISYQYGYDIISGGLYLMNDVRDIVFNSNSPEANQLYVDWTPATPVPAPLPILGAVAAIGWSRKLRRRIRESQALAA